MNFEKIKELLFAEAAKMGLTEYDVYFKMSEELSADALNREPNAFGLGKSGGVSFRCAVDGRIGAASTECLEETELLALVPRAAANAAVTDPDEEPIFFAGSASYQTTTAEKKPLPDTAELRRAAMTLQEQLYGANDMVTDGTTSAVGAAEVTVSLANSKGLSLSHTASLEYSYAEAVVNDGKEPSDGSAIAGMIDPEKSGIAAKAVHEAVSSLGAGHVKTGTYDIILSAGQVRSMLGTFAGIFSGKNALLGLSLLKGKEGTKIASECLTLMDDPFYAENSMQMPFDAEGVATTEKALIDQGVLQTLLYDLTTAKKVGVSTTGNAARGSYADPVSIRPFCLRIAPGEYTPDELLARLGDGLYITELKGLHAGADAVTGDFSIESAGFVVRNGKKAEPVHTFTIAGNFFTLLTAIDGVANKVEMGIPSVTVMAAPDILVRGVSVAGADEE